MNYPVYHEEGIGLYLNWLVTKKHDNCNNIKVNVI